MCDKIRYLEQVILPKFLNTRKTITKCDVDKLTAPGENYGSLMLKVDITLTTPDGESEILHTVAKMVPDNELVQKVFNTQVSFKKELDLYQTVVPTLRGFLKEYGIEHVMNFFPEFYGGRISLDPKTDIVDCNAIILLENLKAKGFECADRNIGFDFKTTSFLLKDLAILHAIPLALKLKKPGIFKSTILPALKNASPVASIPKDIMDNMIIDIIQVASENKQCVPFVEHLRSKLDEISIRSSRNSFVPREPFATFTHSDYWVNNTMIKFENGKPTLNKMVDFQLTEYNSPARDFLFLIFDSVQNDVIREKYDEFLKIYHGAFIETLKLFDINESSFSYEHFLEEIECCANEDVFLQCFVMLRPIFAEKETGKDVEDFKEEDFNVDLKAPQKHKEKMFLLIEEFAKRKWLLPSK